MNAKFFDLKQEKQDRMINAALKVFAECGYVHASTDDIVKEARISKGLLFHYFESKIGVYTFLYDYCARVMSLELSSAVDPGESNYFEIRRQMEAAKMQALKSYPYMSLFLHKCEVETFPEAVLAVEDKKNEYENALGTILARADYAELKAAKCAEMVFKMLNTTLDVIAEEHLRDGSFNAEMFYTESVQYINLCEKTIKTIK